MKGKTIETIAESFKVDNPFPDAIYGVVSYWTIRMFPASQQSQLAARENPTILLQFYLDRFA